MQRLFYYPGYTNHLGFAKSGNDFVVRSSDGRDAGSINMPFLIFPSRVNEGSTEKIEFRANQGFTDAGGGGASEIIGALFGTTTGVAESATPFYVYAISNPDEDNLVIFLSRQKDVNQSPVTADIGDTNDPTNAITIDAFFAVSSITEADYAEQPCVMIGSIEMSKDTSDDWTVSALTAEHGVNRYPKIATGGGGGAWEFISSAEASASSSIAFTDLSSDYIKYMVAIDGLDTPNTGTNLNMRTSSNNGSSYDSGSSDYAWDGDSVDSEITIAESLGGAAGVGSSFNVYIGNPSETKWTYIYPVGAFYGGVSPPNVGVRKSTTAVNAILFFMSSSTLTSGTFKLYGLNPS